MCESIKQSTRKVGPFNIWFVPDIDYSIDECDNRRNC